MNNRLLKGWRICIVLTVCSSVMAFAGGKTENYYGAPGYRGINGPPGMFSRQSIIDDFDNLNTQSVEGKFFLAEGKYPAVIKKTGETCYLLMPFPLSDNQIPAEGAEMKIETIQSPMSPNLFIVVSGQVNGVDFSTDGNNGFGWQGMYGPPHGGGFRDGVDSSADGYNGFGWRGMHGPPRRGGFRGGWGSFTSPE